MADWTIDALAQEAGTTVRNVRVYQDRGLLDPPRRRGRVGIYNDDHLGRLRLVLRLLERGYPMAAIKELIEAWEGAQGLEGVLGFERVLRQPYSDERPERFTVEEIASMFPGEDESLVARVLEVGMLERDGDGFVTRTPGLLRAGAQLVADGVPVDVVTEIGIAVWDTSRQLAQRFVDAFVRWVWEPFAAADMPSDQWPRIIAALETERGLVTTAVSSALGDAMRQATEAAIAQRGDLLSPPTAEPSDVTAPASRP
jgi:DNA-binding transcriptional MerR regulator